MAGWIYGYPGYLQSGKHPSDGVDGPKLLRGSRCGPPDEINRAYIGGGTFCTSRCEEWDGSPTKSNQNTAKFFANLSDVQSSQQMVEVKSEDPFQKQLNEASQRLRNAQIAMMRSGGARQKMELQIAQQAFQTAHALSIQFDNPEPGAGSFSSASRRSDKRSDSGYDTDGSQSVSRCAATFYFNRPIIGSPHRLHESLTTKIRHTILMHDFFQHLGRPKVTSIFSKAVKKRAQ
eukprot:1387746-Amorphochlora_amoeboformis.AAC.1